MKVTETIERNCCEMRDLKPYLGFAKNLRFCIHCGKLHQYIKCPGEMDYGWEELNPEDNIPKPEK